MNIAELGDAIKNVAIIACGRSGGIAVDVCEGGAIKERIFSNTCYGVGDSHGGEREAILERTVSNTCYGVGDGEGGERVAIIERTGSNSCYGVGDGDGGEGGAMHERPVSNPLSSCLNGICT